LEGEVIDEDFEKMNIRGIMVFLHLFGNIRMRREGKGIFVHSHAILLI